MGLAAKSIIRSIIPKFWVRALLPVDSQSLIFSSPGPPPRKKKKRTRRTKIIFMGFGVLEGIPFQFTSPYILLTCCRSQTSSRSRYCPPQWERGPLRGCHRRSETRKRTKFRPHFDPSAFRRPKWSPQLATMAKRSAFGDPWFRRDRVRSQFRTLQIKNSDL